jgi:hypothetical protein
MEAVVLPLTYFGNLAYYKLLLEAETVYIDDTEPYLKQTFRNRMQILAANGLLNLTVPVVSPKGLELSIDQIRIAYDEEWRIKHFKTIRSAYRSAPFFEEYETEIEALFNIKHESLVDLNKSILWKVHELLSLEKEVHFSSEKEIPANAFSYRGYFKPSKTPNDFSDFKPYIQVFNYKFDFVSNLSILDLLFNEGPYALAYLKDQLKKPS